MKLKLKIVIPAVIILFVIIFSSTTVYSLASESNRTKTSSPPIVNADHSMLLRKADNKLINASGEQVILRGVNYPEYCASPGGLWRAQGEDTWQNNQIYRQQAVIDNLNAIANWGCNVIRLHLPIEYWVNDTNNFKNNLKNMISLAGERGIYVIIEFCSNFAYPDTARGGLPYGIYAPEGQYQTQMPNRNAFVNLWKNLASELSSVDNVIYEAYNEPNGSDDIKKEYFAMMQDLINAIRSTNALQPVIIQWGFGAWVNVQYANQPRSLNWVYDYPLHDPVNNLIISTHNYANCIHTGDGSVYVGYDYANVLTYADKCLIDKVAREFPLIIGEIGAINGRSEEIESMKNCLKRFNELQIGYLGWSWTNYYQYALLNPGKWTFSPNPQGQILITAINDGKSKQRLKSR
jgi:hypothetical protein